MCGTTFFLSSCNCVVLDNLRRKRTESTADLIQNLGATYNGMNSILRLPISRQLHLVCRLERWSSYVISYSIRWRDVTASMAPKTYSEKQSAHLVSCRVILGPRDWIQEIPTTLAANGFYNAEKHQYLEAPHMAPFWNDV